MLELVLIAALFFILLAVIASYLFKTALKKSGIEELNTEKTTLIGIATHIICKSQAHIPRI